MRKENRPRRKIEHQQDEAENEGGGGVARPSRAQKIQQGWGEETLKQKVDEKKRKKPTRQQDEGMYVQEDRMKKRDGAT